MGWVRAVVDYSAVNTQQDRLPLRLTPSPDLALQVIKDVAPKQQKVSMMGGAVQAMEQKLKAKGLRILREIAWVPDFECCRAEDELHEGEKKLKTLESKVEGTNRERQELDRKTQLTGSRLSFPTFAQCILLGNNRGASGARGEAGGLAGQGAGAVARRPRDDRERIPIRRRRLLRLGIVRQLLWYDSRTSPGHPIVLLTRLPTRFCLSGAFNGEYRAQLLAKWIAGCHERKIPVSEGLPETDTSRLPT